MTAPGRTTPRMAEPLLWLAVAAGMCVLYAGAAWFADLNQDEGWYLYAGSLVARGQRPFLDFASTQGPVMSLVYGWAHGWVARGGVLGGRLFTALLGILGAGLAAGLTARLSDAPRGSLRRRYAALICLGLCGLSLYQVTFTTTVKTYALTSVLLLLGCHALLPGGGRRGGLVRGLCGGLLLAAAVATRLSAFAVLPVFGLWLLWQARQRDVRPWALARLVGLVVGGGVGAVLLVGPYLWQAWPGVRFGLVTYHAARDGGEGFAALAYKGGFLLRLAGHYLPALAGVIALLTGWLFLRMRLLRGGKPGVGALWGGAAALTLLHLAAPFPYDDYQVIAYPLLCVGLSLGLAGLCTTPEAATEARRLRMLTVPLLLVVLLHGLSGPLFQGWFVAPRDRIWWPLKRETPVQGLRRVAAQLRADGAQPGERLLTQDAYLAVECGMLLPEGLELGPFSIFPDLTEAEARRLHVVNLGMLARLLDEAEPRFAAFSGYALAIGCPGVTELPIDEQRKLWEPVTDRYVEIRREEGFGQAYTTLRVMQKRGRGGEDAE